MPRRIKINTALLKFCITAVGLSACTTALSQAGKEVSVINNEAHHSAKLNQSAELRYAETSLQAESKQWSDNSQPEVKSWLSNTQAEARNWEKTERLPEDRFQHTITAEELSSKQKNRLAESAWLLAKSQPIQVNSLVCTFADNKYGRVTKMSELNLELELIGQAKIVQDGIFLDLAPGALFAGDSKPLVSLLPLHGFQSFSILHVAACQPK